MSAETDSLALDGDVERSLKERTMGAVFLLCTALSVFVTLTMNLIANWVAARYQEEYR